MSESLWGRGERRTGIAHGEELLGVVTCTGTAKRLWGGKSEIERGLGVAEGGDAAVATCALCTRLCGVLWGGQRQRTGGGRADQRAFLSARVTMERARGRARANARVRVRAIEASIIVSAGDDGATRSRSKCRPR